ncbi:hypothetical protein [Fulvivirga lutea]|uniref:Adhesin domain-containing protein n=1 Tax=Fulvivirga lutea TaxID=2810512 RepID=A0A975A1I5_9BACT|nr:hypothetical protein [Fulvivirga lutea]QSE97557.1 hypothetical protein JR347_00260 [Fulvivirga lutea]
MREGILLLGIGIISTTLSVAQVKKQFSIDNNDAVERVDLDFGVNSGTCFIKSSTTGELLTVYGNQDFDSYSHSFNKEITDKTCIIKLNLEDDKSAGLSRSISYRMFGNDEKSSDNLWKMYLSTDKVYDLNLRYGIGNANIDLSGLSIEKVKINTGSADVSFKASDYNKVEMDTFYVQVDMGSVKVENVNLSKSKNIIADVGFGDLLLDFTDDAVLATNVHGSVGAGNLMIVLPSSNTPVKVKISNSWLCKVSLLKTFKDIGNNTFVNDAYSETAPNTLNFNLDVSMGKIIFKEQPISSSK